MATKKTLDMAQVEPLREISLESLERFGKIRNNEDDLSTTIFLDKVKAESIILNVLSDVFKTNMARYNYED